MKISGEFTILDVKYFSMDDNCGLSVRVIGSPREDNNNFGLPTPFATVENYQEINFLKQFKPSDFPIKVNCDISMVTVKDGNKNEKASMQLSNLSYVCHVGFIDNKPVLDKAK